MSFSEATHRNYCLDTSLALADTRKCENSGKMHESFRRSSSTFVFIFVLIALVIVNLPSFAVIGFVMVIVGSLS